MTTGSSIPSPQTVVYKTARGNAGEEIDIPLDVYVPSSAASSAPPVPVIWVHTGGFLQGTRKFAPQHLLRSANKHNFAVVAPDFRLAPQVDLPTILGDIADCIQFTLSGQLSSTIGTPLDTSRHVLAGSSAGGWASLLLGLNLVPSLGLPVPSAVIAIYPITTVARSVAPYFYTPLKPLPWPYSISAKVGDTVPGAPLVEHMDRHAKVRTEASPAAEPARATLYNYARQEGTYPSLILREDQDAELYCVATQVKKQLTGAKAAPALAFIAYGDADIMVETSQSDVVIEALRAAKVNVKTHIEPGKSHVWDILDPSAEIPGLWESVAQAVQ